MTMTNNAIGWVYFFASDDAVKIGRTRNLRRRGRDLSVASASPLLLVGAVLTPRYQTLEGITHAKLAHVHLRGEWFECAAAVEEYQYLAQRFKTYHALAQLHEGEPVPSESILSSHDTSRAPRIAGLRREALRPRLSTRGSAHCVRRPFLTRSDARRSQANVDGQAIFRCSRCSKLWHAGTLAEAGTFGVGLVYSAVNGRRIRL